MRSSMLVARILCTLFVFVSLSAAWPWPPYAGSEGHGVVIKRQDKNDDKTTETKEAKPTASADTATETGKTEKESGKDKATGTKTSDSKETGTETGTKTEEATSTITDIDPRDPPGGIKMVEPPAAQAQSSYYKIGDHVTFKWNYTSLSVTPTGINVVASCSVNNQEYTITSNETVHETGSVVWDTGAYQANATVPLLTETYTLLVYDVDREPTEVAPPGHLGGFGQFMFGMYTPQPYTPLSDYECATCNAALSAMERQALGFSFAMATITILSFAWFANGFGVFS